MFRIGEFARFTRVSVKMLRHYDEIGLLAPARVDPATGYRWYTADQLPRLNRIVLLRDLGFGLDDVADLLDKDIDEIYRRRERQLDQAITQAQAQVRAVRARRELIREADNPADVVVRSVDAMLVATVDGPAGGDVGALFSHLETYVRDNGARAGRPPLTLLPEPDDETVTVAVPLTWPIPPAEGIMPRLLEAVPRMACAVHRGGYGGLSGLLQRMLRWLDRTGELPGAPIREVYLRFGAEHELALPRAYLTDEPADLVTELQVPLLTAAARPTGEITS